MSGYELPVTHGLSPEQADQTITPDVFGAVDGPPPQSDSLFDVFLAILVTF
ncbi:hypothetical protein ACFL6U_07005 [Planctomycetota bacterium]